jgi:hypothetical protein
LHNNCEDNDENKEVVAKESSKYVIFGPLEFSGVDFVKNLEKNENVEENCVVLSVFVVPGFVHSSRWNAKELISLEENKDENSHLEKGVANDVSPHDWCDHVFVSAVWFSFQEFIRRSFSSEGKRGESVHN